MSVALAIGALTAMGALARRERLPPPDTSVLVADCTIALVLVGVDNSIVARTVDRVTGRLGFSHAYIDPCRTSSTTGDRVIVDYTPRKGVHWSSGKEYRGRRRVRVELNSTTGTELWGCVRSRIGKPYGPLLPMAWASSASHCVGLILACMPGSLRAALERMRVGPCVSPNTLAAYFGVGDD